MGSYISIAMNFSPGFCPWQGGEVGLIYCQALLLCFADLALQVFYISFPTGLYFFQPTAVILHWITPHTAQSTGSWAFLSRRLCNTGVKSIYILTRLPKNV